MRSYFDVYNVEIYLRCADSVTGDKLDVEAEAKSPNTTLTTCIANFTEERSFMNKITF